MKPANIIVALILLFLFSCDDEPSMKNGSFDVTGVIIDEASKEPIENVEIIGYNRKVQYLFQGQPVNYVKRVSLGMTDKCGKFKITLSDSIKGKSVCFVGRPDSTIVMLRLSRPDFGEKDVTIPFGPGAQTFSMGYAPIPDGFFKLLYLVQSEDRKSVHIGWNIPSLENWRFCGGNCLYCLTTSNGNVQIWRSDSTGARHIIPFELNTDQMVTDSDLPPHGDFTYNINVGVESGVSYAMTGTIIRTSSDTVFLAKSPVFTTLNHCN